MRMRAPTPATLVRVVDGDTLVLQLACPCCLTVTQQRVRLARIDAPELNSVHDAAARRAQCQLAAIVDRGPITVSVTRTHPDKYGRLLAEVIVNGVSVSDTMVATGHAQYWDGKISTKPWPIPIKVTPPNGLVLRSR